MKSTTFTDKFLDELLEQAGRNPRLRQGYDLRTGADDGSQRMLNALQPGTVVGVHRHGLTTETVVCLRGRLDEVIFEERDGKLAEAERIALCPREGRYGCQVAQGAWHTVEVREPSVILETKDCAYGADGSEAYDNR